jgi:hypothetical protein
LVVISGRKKTPLFRVIVLLELDAADRQEPSEVFKTTTSRALA